MDRVIVGAHGAIRFSATRIIAHGARCEPLHGRDFYVQATLTGHLGTTGRVIDFRSVQAALAAFCALHVGRILVPLRNEALTVQRDADLWHVTHATRRWSLPACDVTVLDVANPTNEALAALCLTAVRQALHDDPEARLLTHLEITIGDAEGIAHHTETWVTP